MGRYSHREVRGRKKASPVHQFMMTIYDIVKKPERKVVYNIKHHISGRLRISGYQFYWRLL